MPMHGKNLLKCPACGIKNHNCCSLSQVIANILQLFSFPWHLVNKLLFDKFVCSLRVEWLCSNSQQDIGITQEFRVLHLQLHILDELLVRGLLFYYKLNVAPIAFEHTDNINFPAIQSDLQIQKIPSLLPLIQCPQFCADKLIQGVGSQLTLPFEPWIINREWNFVQTQHIKNAQSN